MCTAAYKQIINAASTIDRCPQCCPFLRAARTATAQVAPVVILCWIGPAPAITHCKWSCEMMNAHEQEALAGARSMRGGGCPVQITTASSSLCCARSRPWWCSPTRCLHGGCRDAPSIEVAPERLQPGQSPLTVVDAPIVAGSLGHRYWASP